MKVLLTGGSGFIGSGVLDYMLEHTDWEFTAICSWRHHGSPLNIAAQPRVSVVTHDLTGPLPDMGDFDYILNLASESHTERSIIDPVPFVENNVSSTLQVLEYARKHMPKVFLQFSTDEVYGAFDHKEWDLLLPGNPYSASKAAQEVIAISYWRTYGLPIVITNSNNIIGSHQHPEKFVPKLIGLIQAGEEVQIHQSNGQPGRRHYNPVQNVADALLFILNREPAMYGVKRDVRLKGLTLMDDGGIELDAGYVMPTRPDRYNLPGGAELDNLEMAQLIAKKLGKPLKYKLVDAQAARPGYDQFYPKTDGILTKLGWLPPLTLEQGLTELVAGL